MDATLDDFLNEINEIAPLQTVKPVQQSEWHECYDETSGFNYYWNTRTDEVSWIKPLTFRSIQDIKKDQTIVKTSKSAPTKSPLFPGASTSQKAVKVNHNSVRTVSCERNGTRETKKVIKKVTKSFKGSDSEDERIILISSYGDESDSYASEDDSKSVSKPKPKEIVPSEDEDEEEDILTTIQKRAKELEKEKTVAVAKKPISQEKKLVETPLVVGYSDSEEENDKPLVTLPFIPKSQSPPKESHSTLFPVAPQINVNDFLEEKSSKEKLTEPSKTSEFIDTKAFQRKRRIGVALINTKKPREELDPENCDRKGFGFRNENAEENTSKVGSTYPGFTKGGVMFVKADVLNPVQEENSLDKDEKSNSSFKDKEETPDEVMEMYETLKEKLGFLAEGRPTVSPVQVMIIQAETLLTAMTDGSLTISYLRKWLNQTCSDLIKLEKDATPEGWLLQWDRSQKRYYYQNQSSGESQWEYPQSDVRCEEAMDICTTPPPGPEPSTLQPPLPPAVVSPSPPPPPSISQEEECRNAEMNDKKELATEPSQQPLPPGVEQEDATSKNSGSLDSVLDSFYSDIAAIEGGKASPKSDLETGSDSLGAEGPKEDKKKKKTKVKITQGLSMKKKGVSKLVEKWKNVQMNYD